MKVQDLKLNNNKGIFHILGLYLDATIFKNRFYSDVSQSVKK